ncbi:MAG: hypothetical protein AB7F75_12750 [Planctomycetota bacterium]
MNIWAISCDPSTIHLLNVACKEAKHELCVFQSVSEAEQNKPALIFIESAGMEASLASHISELHRKHPQSMIALVTGDTIGAQNISQLASLGVGAYISKPPTLSDLAGIIRKAQG